MPSLAGLLEHLEQQHGLTEATARGLAAGATPREFYASLAEYHRSQHGDRVWVVFTLPGLGSDMEVAGSRLTKTEADRLADRTARSYATRVDGDLTDREQEALRRWTR